MARRWARSGAGPTNARFLEIGSQNWRRSQVAFERHFFGRSQLAPEPAPESAPRLNVPVKCGHDDDVNPVASNLFFFRVQRYPNFQSIHRTFSTRISQMPTIILEKKEPKRSNTSNSQENSLHTAAPSRDCFHSSESPDRSSKPNVTYRHRPTE